MSQSNAGKTFGVLRVLTKEFIFVSLQEDYKGLKSITC